MNLIEDRSPNVNYKKVSSQYVLLAKAKFQLSFEFLLVACDLGLNLFSLLEKV